MRELIFASVMILFGQSIASAQSTPIMIDQFPAATCEDVLSRMDALFINLANQPGSVGLITIPESESEPLRNLKLESLIYGAITVKRFGFDRIRVIRITGSESAVTFWLVPMGADQPKIVESSWKLTLGLKRAKMFFSDGPMFDAICLHDNSTKQFVELLIANPEYRGNIVLRGPRLRLLRRQVRVKSEALKPIPRSRLRFFFVKEKETTFEYWLVLPKRKQ